MLRVHTSCPYVLSVRPVLTSEVCPCLCVCVCVLSLLPVVVCVSTALWCFCFRVPLREDPPSDFTPPPWAHRSVSPSSGLYKQRAVGLLNATLTADRSLVCMFVFVGPPRPRLKAGPLTVMRKVLLFAWKSSSSDRFVLCDQLLSALSFFSHFDNLTGSLERDFDFCY